MLLLLLCSSQSSTAGELFTESAANAVLQATYIQTGAKAQVDNVQRYVEAVVVKKIDKAKLTVPVAAAGFVWKTVKTQSLSFRVKHKTITLTPSVVYISWSW